MSSTPEWATARALADYETFTLSVNGEQRRVTYSDDTPLLYLLRNDFGLTGSRFGCGLGQCGACMVLLNGQPTPSCDLPVSSVDSKEILTIEGLSNDDEMSLLQQLFVAEQAAQCGFCMSGILISATALLRRRPRPDEAEVRAALDRNLCRCGTHTRVLRAVLRAVEDACPN